MKIKIQNKFISNRSKTFIIAEIGINHDGNFFKCKKLISAANRCGADAVKLQIIDPEKSYSKNTKSYRIFKYKTLSFKELLKLKKFSQKKRIILFATPGDFPSLSVIKKLKFPITKISSGLLTNEPLIVESARLNLPIIVSTGLAYYSEIKKAVKIIENQKNGKIIILKCTSLYPAKEKELNLLGIQKLKKNFKYIIGYSDHTLSNLACYSAVNLGAKVIEKHFTLDNKSLGADHKISANPKQFKNLVDNIRRIESMHGDKNKFPNKLEKTKRNIFHRSIITSKYIKKGEKFSLENFDLKRSLGRKQGLHPKFYSKLLGKKSKRSIKANTKLKFHHVF